VGVGGDLFEADRLWYHSTLGSRVVQKKKEGFRGATSCLQSWSEASNVIKRAQGVEERPTCVKKRARNVKESAYEVKERFHGVNKRACDVEKMARVVNERGWGLGGATSCLQSWSEAMSRRAPCHPQPRRTTRRILKPRAVPLGTVLELRATSSQ